MFNISEQKPNNKAIFTGRPQRTSSGLNVDKSKYNKRQGCKRKRK